jgi:hypothetical protein
MSKAAVAEAASDAEILRIRFAMGELQAKCDRQVQEIATLRAQANESGQHAANQTTDGNIPLESHAARPVVSDVRPAKTQCVQACQTEERMFVEQLDLVHREAAQKGKELRKTQETVRLLRMELQQEKVMSDQFRGQVDGLERQLQDAMQKQHRAEGERTLVEWRLRNAEGAGPGRPGTSRASRSSTPQPSASRNLIKAWAEPGKISSDDGEPMASGNMSEALGSPFNERPSSEKSQRIVQDSPRRQPQLSRGMMGEESGEESVESDGEGSVAASDGSEDMEVFHPPPSRGGLRR